MILRRVRIKIVFRVVAAVIAGAYCVLVWAGRFHRSIREMQLKEEDYVFKFNRRDVGKAGYGYQLRMVRVAGRWEVW